MEEAVLLEFNRIAERGGVLGAMETGYQRGKIQDESIYYEVLKHTGKHPIVGVNTFRDPHADDMDLDDAMSCLELARSTEEEKQSQLNRLAEFQKRNQDKAPEALARLQQTALQNGNIFGELMDTVRSCSLGQITQAQLLKLAEEKIKDTNAGSLETCARSLAGTARSMGVDVVGVSSLAAGHLTLVPELKAELERQGRPDIMIVVGGVVPPQDYDALLATGASAIFPPGTVIAEAAGKLLDELNERLGYGESAAAE